MGQTCYPERHEHESNMMRRRRISSIDLPPPSDPCISIPKEDGYMSPISAERRKKLLVLNESNTLKHGPSSFTQSLHSKTPNTASETSQRRVSGQQTEMKYDSWREAVESADRVKLAQLLKKHFSPLTHLRWNDGSTALHVACRKNNYNLASFLLDQHIDVNEKTTDTHDTALHIAVRNQNEKLVQLLLEWDADIKVKNKKCETPQCIATNKKIRELLKGNWFVLIGARFANLIPSSLQNELKNECMSLIADKDKLNYRNKHVTRSDAMNNIRIQDLIEPCKPSFDQLQSDGKVKPYIPAIFRLNEEINWYEIKTEINDLPKGKYANLYSVIERIFNRMAGKIRDKMESDEYYVTVKMTDFQLMDPYDCFYRDEDFHFVGFENEYIKEIALYYFDISDNINGGGIVFKDEKTYGRGNNYHSWSWYGLWGFGKNEQPIAVTDNDCVIFTNNPSLQYKMDKMSIRCLINKNNEFDASQSYKNKNGAKVFGTHKVLAFYIADPTKHDKIKTSKDLVVNIESKIDQIVDYWMREVELMSNDDVSMIILAFVCNAELIKKNTDTNRLRRLLVGKTQNLKDSLNDTCRIIWSS